MCPRRVRSRIKKIMLRVKNKNVAFTITAKNRLPSAMICRDTFLEQNPDADFITFFADQTTSHNDIALLREAGPLIGCNELKQLATFKKTNKFEEMAYKYDVVEFCTAVKPFCIEYLFWSGYEKVLYFDPDIVFFEPVESLYDALTRYQCVLTPHITSPMPVDNKRQNDMEILSCGAYNLGFGGWSLSQEVLDFIAWWQNQMKVYCFHDVHHHMFVDQYWMGFAPCFLETYIVKHPGCNAAYWNLHERQYEFKRGKWYVNDKPLIFYHYSGLDYFNPYNISRHQNRFNLNNRPELSKLFFNYVKQLYNYDALERIGLPYYYDTVHDTRLDENRKFQVADAFGKQANPWLVDKKHFKDTTSTKPGINIIGYFPYIAGTGEVARNLTQKVYSTGIAYVLHPVQTQKVGIRPEEEYEYSLYYSQVPGHDTSIFCINLDQISYLKDQKPFLFTDRNIGVFWWELEDTLPFSENLECVDELLCFTKFTADIFKKFTNKPVHKLPYPFIAPKPGTFNNDSEFCKRKLGLEGDFVFYFNFDYASSYERKNPVGLLKAFAKVAKGRKKVRLVIKTLNAELFPREATNLDFTCKELAIDDKVLIIDGPMPKADLLALTSMCDCYISLHRSEGGGLGILEALYLGKPVVATAYGGNMEFMDSNNSLPVMYSTVQLPSDVFNVYKAGGTWADPYLDDAVTKMIMVVENKKFRAELGGRATQSIVEYADMLKFNEAFYKIMEDK
jgi:glycosyltransferase involved in cell wall biosynthesis